MPVDPDETADQRARRRELEAAGQLGLPEDALGLDADDDAEEHPAGAVTTEGRRGTSWRPGGGPWRPQPEQPLPEPPTEPTEPPTEPPAAVGPVVLVKSASDLKKLKSNTTYQFTAGYTHRQQLVLKNLKNVTLIDPRITGTDESCIYVVNSQNVTIRGGSLTNSRRKSGILTDGTSNGLVMIGVTCAQCGEHGAYVGSGTGDVFEIRDCIFESNARCAIQLNPELGGDRVIKGGRITGCTMKGNAKSEGAALNLGAWVDGLLQDCVIEGNAKGIALWQGDGAQASRNIRITGCIVRKNSGYSLKCSNGSSGHKLSGCTFDKRPEPGGWSSDGTNKGPGSGSW